MLSHCRKSQQAFARVVPALKRTPTQMHRSLYVVDRRGELVLGTVVSTRLLGRSLELARRRRILLDVWA